MQHPVVLQSSILGLTTGALWICMAPWAMAHDPISRHVEHMASQERPAEPIEAASAHLVTSPDGALMWMTTSELVPGHVTTAWWVIMTNPQQCSATPCTPEDVIGRAAEVGTQIVFADSAINAEDGTAVFAAFLPSGPVSGGWYDQSFDDPSRAEIHLVLNDHGPLIPELAETMLTSYRGGCHDDSLPPPFPDSAKADGIAGPNSCQLIQDSIFVQGASQDG